MAFEDMGGHYAERAWGEHCIPMQRTTNKGEIHGPIIGTLRYI
jgi:hypothetical protein